ncbi:allophanate hydrolase-related protein [Agarivorans sp. QJM3NY_25]|uniref:allophanate hydrolase-related protein n=1 Tax=Agarivorans sp. QJM3NY_25 TaxID=3421430 RepID=UPI003D7C453C
MPWDYGAATGIVRKWADKYNINIDMVQVNDYIESINQYTAGVFAATVMTSMNALTIPTASGVDSTALIVGDFSNGNDGVVLKGDKSLADLKGQKVNLVELSVSHYLLARGLPFGIIQFSQALHDRKLLSIAALLQQHDGYPLGATGQPLPPLAELSTLASSSETIELAVCGAHLSGLALNHQLLERGASLLKQTTSASCYHLYALAGGPPARPGLIRDEAQGQAIELEVWRMPSEQLGRFLQGIAQPLGLGKVELADGQWVNSFICEGYAIANAQEITAYGGWRNYLASL